MDESTDPTLVWKINSWWKFFHNDNELMWLRC